LIVRPQVPAWQAKLTNISPNAGATYRSESTSAPITPRLGDLWYQTDTQLNKRYDGTDWQNVGASPLEASSTAGIAFETATGKVKIYDDGSFEFGTLNAAKNAGGIGYDVTEDRLYGNVAYDQWDLVIESDADLALLTSGSTIYKNVLVAPGTWTTEAQIDLSAHGVERFVGISPNVSIIDLYFPRTALSPMIYCGNKTEIGSLTFISTYTHTVTGFIVIQTGLNYKSSIHNCIFTGFEKKGSGIDSSNSTESFITECTFDGMASGVYRCRNITNCTFVDCNTAVLACSVINNCYAKECSTVAYSESYYISNSIAVECVEGFYLCEYITSCSSSATTGSAYESCKYISSCFGAGGDKGFDTCSYISSSFISTSTTKWTGNTEIDYDSTNCDQQWAYGNSGANVTTSGWVIPRGTYQFVKSSTSESVFLEIYDGSGWIRANQGVITSTNAYAGIVMSDGTNMRLISASDTQTVYWRKKP
jgi:hypothetical protein